MKRILALFLCIVLCLSAFTGCGGEKEEETGSGAFSVGFAKGDVSPTQSLPLDGYQGMEAAQFRWSTITEWPYYVICTAFTDAKNNTFMVITGDLLNAFMADAMRTAVSSETGVPKEHIMFHVTHNHSGVALRIGEPAVTEYLTQLTSSVISVSKKALEDRKPVTGMYTTFARPEGINSERHYLLADGSYQGKNLGSVPKDQIIGHYGVADNLLQLVKFTREGGKDVVLVNWQAHPQRTDPITVATSNYPGVLRNYLETNLNCEAMFILGGSGNLNNGSQIANEIRHSNYQQAGEMLGQAAVEAAANFTQRNLDEIRINEKEVRLNTKDGGALDVWLYAISIGDFALVTAPFEIFDDNAVAVREDSPYGMTMYASCCNGSNQYLSTPPSFDWRITYEAAGSNWPKGTAEIVQGHLTDMLNEIATDSGYQAADKGEGYYQTFEPKSDDVLYQIFPNSFREVENGFVLFQAIGTNNSVKNMLALDQAVAAKLQVTPAAKLIFNEQNVVVGIVE